MKEIWDEFWKLLEKADKILDGFISSGSDNELMRFVKSWNNIKKKTAELDKFMQPAAPIQIDLPFDSEEFQELWTRYKEYLSEQHGQTMRTRSEKSALELLMEMTEKDCDKACFIIRHAMATRSKNFYYVTKQALNNPDKSEDKGSSFD